MTELAKLIRRRRLELRLTQRAAAERAGLSLATWQNLERPTSNPDGFQELTLSRAAHSLRLGLPMVFDVAGQPLPEPPPLSGDGANPEATDDGEPPNTDELLAHLDQLLRQLAERSPAGFMIVYGQAAETAQHLLDLDDPPAAS